VHGLPIYGDWRQGRRLSELSPLFRPLFLLAWGNLIQAAGPVRSDPLAFFLQVLLVVLLVRVPERTGTATAVAVLSAFSKQTARHGARRSCFTRLAKSEIAFFGAALPAQVLQHDTHAPS
jgi:hypothetical protein